VNDDDVLRAWWLPSADDGRQGSFFVECPSCGWSMNVHAANPPEGLSMHTDRDSPAVENRRYADRLK
jgi:hypothetical protein